MSALLHTVAFVFILGFVVAVYFLRKANGKPRVRPPPRSKSTERTYQETNSVAGLFLQVVALKESGTQWPRVLRRLNPDDEPHVRTLLLEMRGCHGTDPHAALEALERVCIASKHESDHLSRAELLERAKAILLSAEQK